MKKIYVLLAIAIVGIFIYSTTVYIPEGYTAVTRDGRSLYSEGVHPFQKYPFEHIRLTRLSEQCEAYDRYVELNDGARIETNIKVCWKITRDINKINDLYTLYAHGRDYADYQELLIYPSVMSNTFKAFDGFNETNLRAYDLNVSHDILDETQRDLADKGIIITEIQASLPGFEPFKEAIQKRNEIIKTEAEAIRIQEEVNRLEQIRNNTTNVTWINDVPENQADFFIEYTKDAFYAKLVKEHVIGIVPTLSFSKGPSRYGVPGFVGIYAS